LNTSTQALFRLYLLVAILYRVLRPQVLTWSAHNYASQHADKGAGFAGRGRWVEEEQEVLERYGKIGKNSTCIGQRFAAFVPHPKTLRLRLLACQCNLCKFIGKYFVIFLFLSSCRQVSYGTVKTIYVCASGQHCRWKFATKKEQFFLPNRTLFALKASHGDRLNKHTHWWPQHLPRWLRVQN